MPHLPLPGMPPFFPDHPLTCISHITPNSPAPAYRCWEPRAHIHYLRGPTNPSSCHCKGSWDSTTLTSLSFASLQPVPQPTRMEALSPTLRFSGAALRKAQRAAGGSGNTLCVFPAASPTATHPGSLSFPSLVVPSPDTSLSNISRKRNGPKGVRLPPLPDHVVQSHPTTVPISILQRKQTPGEDMACPRPHS